MRRYLQVGAIALALLACSAAKAGVTQDSEAQAGKGTLVIIGGALRPDNAPVWERVVALAGGKGAAIAVFATAAASPEKSAEQIAQRLRHYGAAPFVVPVAPQLAGSDYRKAADDVAIAARVSAAGGAYFAGGEQGRITQALRRADGSNTRVLDALWTLYRRGGVIAGTSAGAAMMSSTMFYQPADVLDTLLQGVRDGTDLADGLGFIGNQVFIDQHLLVRGRFARMLPAMLKKGYQLGLGIDEDTALVVTGRQDVEVIGATGALLLELKGATTDRNAAGFNISNARISYLDSGDRINLADGSFAPGGGKVLSEPRPALGGTLFTADILAHTAVLHLMEKMVASGERVATGLAFKPASAIQAGIGVEFSFRQVDDTRSWASPLSESLSILNVRLDVRQIRMAAPLYRSATP